MWTCRGKGPTCKVHLYFFRELSSGMNSIKVFYKVPVTSLQLMFTMTFYGIQFLQVKTYINICTLQLQKKYICNFFIELIPG